MYSCLELILCNNNNNNYGQFLYSAFYKVTMRFTIFKGDDRLLITVQIAAMQFTNMAIC